MIKSLKGQKGLGLIEVIIALGLLGIVGVAFLAALATASTAIITSDKQATAESLARSALEYVKSQDYIDYSQDPHAEYNMLSAQPDYPDYNIDTQIEPFDPDGGGIFAESGGVFEQDLGIQLITVTVNFIPEDLDVIVLQGYNTVSQ